jgi:predicted permease
VILDYDDWAQRFGADPGIVDRRIRIGGTPFTVIGIAPKGFTGIDHDVHPAFYIPLAMFTTVQNGAPPFQAMRDRRELTVKGRLKPGVSIDEARREVQQIATNLERSYPDTNQSHGLTVQSQLAAFSEGPGLDTGLVAMLMTLAFAVLIVACANVAGLLTSRAPVRAREIAMRLAMGAGHLRVVRQLVSESLLIAVGGGTLGLLAGYGVIELFRRVEFPTDIPLKLTFELDGRAFAVGVFVAAASAVLSSLLPAWRAARVDLVQTMRSSTSDSASRSSRARGRSLLVCSQVALSVVLLTVSVFLYRSFYAELNRGLGFRAERLLMMTFDPGLARYDAPRTDEFYRRLTDRVRALPGVTAVAVTSTAPLKTDGVQLMPIAPEGFQFQPGTNNVGVMLARVDDGYFDTLEIPLVKGRRFLPTDTSDRLRVAIVNQRLAAHYWPGQDPIGKRIRLDGEGGAFAEVVGVAADAKYFFPVEPPIEYLYLARMQGSGSQNTLLVATSPSAAAMVGVVRDAVRSIDPNIPIFGTRTMDDFYASRVLYTTNLLLGSVTGMGVLGLTLAMVGLYGLVAYAASRRTREIGVRIAVGATPGAVLRMMLRQGFALAVCGAAVGVLGSVATRGALQSVFRGAARVDAMTYVLVVPVLIAVTLLAAYIPARRAAHVDPLRALRTE